MNPLDSLVSQHVDETTMPMLVDARSAAKLLSISERSLWSLSNRGDLPSVRIGRRRLYDRRDLTAFIDRHKTPDAMTLAV
jgi:predicted DNA-binding transcriptional regulator AlpA